MHRQWADGREKGREEQLESHASERRVVLLRGRKGVWIEHDGDPTVFGHSFGGLVTLAATEEVAFERLVLYEPAVLVEEFRGQDLAARMQQRLDAGARRGAMKLFFREAGGVPVPERLPIWPEDVNFDLLETVIRESEAIESYELPANPEVECPTLLLTGERGPEHIRTGLRSPSGWTGPVITTPHVRHR